LLRLEAVRQTIRMDEFRRLSGDPAESPVGDPPDGQWMTLAELAAARGVSKATAARLVRRKRWRRQPGNDGHVRVFVPEGMDQPALERLAERPAADPEGAIAVAQAALAAQARAESRAEKAESRVAALATEVAAERARIASLEATLAARDAELARRKRGFWGRFRRSRRE
jgi:hypothetical protein